MERASVTYTQESTRTYFFQAEIEKEEDGRWSAWIEALPGCATWGHTKEEALEALHDAAEAYIEDMIDAGDELPRSALAMKAPGIIVTV